MKRRSNAGVCFFDLPDTTDVEAVYGTNVVNEFHRHAHASLSIGLVEMGVRVIRQNDRTEIVPAGRAFVINPHMSHMVQSGENRGHHYGVLCLGSNRLKKTTSHLFSGDDRLPYFPRISLPDNALTFSLHRFFQRIKDSEVPPSELETLLKAILNRLILRHAAQPSHFPPVQRPTVMVEYIREYISTNYAQTITLDQLARFSGLSPFHLQRLFLKETGVSPQVFQTQVRIKAAQKLLLEGLNIANVALDTGFVDQSHFTRFFKRIVGIPPGEYVRWNRPSR